MVETSFGGDVRERAVAIVVVERVAVNATDKQVGPAVIVVVGDGYGDVKARAEETGFFRHVGKHAVAVVSVKTVRELRGILFESLDIGAVGEKDIGTAILVVVKNRHATGHGGGSVRALQGLVGLDAEGQGCEREFDLGRYGRGGCGTFRNSEKEWGKEKNYESRETNELCIRKGQPEILDSIDRQARIDFLTDRVSRAELRSVPLAPEAASLDVIARGSRSTRKFGGIREATAERVRAPILRRCR